MSISAINHSQTSGAVAIPCNNIIIIPAVGTDTGKYWKILEGLRIWIKENDETFGPVKQVG